MDSVVIYKCYSYENMVVCEGGLNKKNDMDIGYWSYDYQHCHKCKHKNGKVCIARCTCNINISMFITRNLSFLKNTSVLFKTNMRKLDNNTDMFKSKNQWDNNKQYIDHKIRRHSMFKPKYRHKRKLYEKSKVLTDIGKH